MSDAAGLGFSVRIATTEADLHEARAIRAAAYSHHDPELGCHFGAPEALDTEEGSAVFICRSKGTGEGVGTMRIQTSAFGPLVLESSVLLPAWLADKSRAQISRLAIVAGADPLVKLALMKVSYQYCLALGVRWMVIGARKPALIRNYLSLGFRDVFDDGQWVPLASGGGLPHRMLALDVAGAQADWLAKRNRLYGFMVETRHAELQVLGEVAEAPLSPPLSGPARVPQAEALPQSDFAALV